MRRLIAALVLVTAATVAGGAAVLMVAGPSLLAPAGSGNDAASGAEAPVPAPLTKGEWAASTPPIEALKRMEPGETQEAALRREPPRAPLSELGLARAPDPSKPAESPKVIMRYRLLHRPLAPAAGRIEVEGFRIRIAGIEPVPVERMCSSVGGDKPCGMMARTAFRNWLRARSIHCSVPDVPVQDEIETSCSVAGEDVAAWLASQGWGAVVADTGALAAVSDDAEQARRGLHAFSGDGL